ncbi:MAG: S-layer homology domain-containing protein, partial [Peptococcaceae bacterium]|nr:S-layer homology domain-containing protein [Peptococcaceae bacterium]
AYTADIILTATWTANHYTVVFEANGGSGTMAPQTFTYDAAQALAAASFTRAGHTFEGWNTAADGSGTSFADGANVVNLSAEDSGRVTLYAQWTEDAKYSLSGQVNESDGTGAAGATVILMQGAEKIAKTTTDSRGHYVFTNIPAGAYNIVTEKGDVTTTTMVTVDADHETIDTITLPEGSKNTIVDNSEAGAFAATVGGLNEIAAAETVANGETVTITLAVTEKEDVTNSVEAGNETLKQEQAAIKQEAAGQTLAFLDLSLLKTTTQNGVEGTPENIGGSNDNLLTIVVPFATDNRRHITVYRYHDTAAEALPEGSENAVNGEYFSVGDGVVTICAKKFSTYAIGYTNPPSTGGSVGLAPIVTETEHGSVSLSPSRPSVGQTVTITPQPDEGYTMAAITVTDASGQALTVTKNHDGTWSYEQPRGQVTIAVTFRLASNASDCPQDDSCPLAGYSDLQMHTWYHDCVHYCLENGLMVGTAQGVFSPDAALTRAQAVVILWRNEGSPLVEQPLDFDDVADDAWYADAVRWAVAADVMSGYGNGRFGADDPMTREQMASMFHRFALQKGVTVSDGAAVDLNRFSDADAISSWALDVVQWACDTGLLRGFEDGKLDPTGNTTRAQYSAMIMRFLEDITQ